MCTTVRTILGLTVLGSSLVLVLSIWPGALVDLLIIAFFLSVLSFPFVAAAFLVLAIVLYPRHRQGLLGRLPVWETRAIPVVMAVTLALLILGVPRRIAFLVSRPAFEEMAARAPTSEFRGAPIHSRLGVYRVDEYAADPRGGVFFRVYSGIDGIGPDIMSYGFAKRPNRRGTPFGAADYRVFHLVDDWYLFQASNDWYSND